jgi:hypothetical protein
MGQDLLQMVNAGFNPLQEISRRTGIDIIDLKKRMEDGAISAKMVEDAFKSAAGPTGRFGGMMDRMGKTATGAFEQLKSAVQEVVATTLAGLLPALASTAKLMEQIVRIVGPVLTPVFRIFGSVLSTITEGLEAIIAVLTDTGRLIVSIASMSPWSKLNTEFAATNALLDKIENRAKGAGNQIANAGVETDGLKWDFQDAAKTAEKMKASFADQVKELRYERLELMGMADLARRLKLQAEGYTDQQIRILEVFRAQNEAIKKRQEGEKRAADETIRQRERMARKLEEFNEAFKTDVADVVAAARDFFERDQQNRLQRMRDVAAGPGAGMEVGSAESAKFFADQVNRQIGAASVPQQPTPGEKEIAAKAADLFKAQQRANLIHERQVQKTEELLEQFKLNGFRRIR